MDSHYQQDYTQFSPPPQQTNKAYHYNFPSHNNISNVTSGSLFNQNDAYQSNSGYENFSSSNAMQQLQNNYGYQFPNETLLKKSRTLDPRRVGLQQFLDDDNLGSSLVSKTNGAPPRSFSYDSHQGLAAGSLDLSEGLSGKIKRRSQADTFSINPNSLHGPYPNQNQINYRPSNLRDVTSHLFSQTEYPNSSFPYPDLSSMQKSHSLSSIERTNLLRKNDSTLLRSNSSLLSDPATSGGPEEFSWLEDFKEKPKPKSRTTFRACVNCKKAHLACDVSRPCKRCVHLGKSATCIDVEHKKRGRPKLQKSDGTKKPSKLKNEKSSDTEGEEEEIEKEEEILQTKKEVVEPKKEKKVAASPPKRKTPELVTKVNSPQQSENKGDLSSTSPAPFNQNQNQNIQNENILDASKIMTNPNPNITLTQNLPPQPLYNQNSNFNEMFPKSDFGLEDTLDLPQEYDSNFDSSFSSPYDNFNQFLQPFSMDQEFMFGLQGSEPLMPNDQVNLIDPTPSDGVEILTTHTLDGNFTYADSEFSALFGFSENEILGRSFYEFVYPEDQNLLFELHNSILSKREAKTPAVKMRVRHRDGHFLEVELIMAHLDANTIVCTLRLINDPLQIEQLNSFLYSPDTEPKHPFEHSQSFDNLSSNFGGMQFQNNS